ncbi:MAG: hypothetical protein ACJ790_00425 [Myxococcaceae bacterium]
MKIPEHDIIDSKWLIARATFAAKPREEERQAAAEELLAEIVNLNGLHGIAIEAAELRGIRVAVPGGAESVIAYRTGQFFVTRSGKESVVPVSYDAGLRMFVGALISDAAPGRNGTRPRVAALVTLFRAALGDAAEVK